MKIALVTHLWIPLFLIGTLSVALAPVNDPEKHLLEISAEYQTYSRGYNADTLASNAREFEWTIQLCAEYAYSDNSWNPHPIDSAYFSQAAPHLSLHGNKLYKLYVRDKASYLTPGNQPYGQTLVKETWNVREVPADSLQWYSNRVQSRNDGKWYRPTTVYELFVMYKEEPAESNDEGWVYGIVDLENTQAPAVLSQGRISNCIACHKNTKYDRMFGKN